LKISRKRIADRMKIDLLLRRLQIKSGNTIRSIKSQGYSHFPCIKSAVRAKPEKPEANMATWEFLRS
jgi:hypothetical protein